VFEPPDPRPRYGRRSGHVRHTDLKVN